MVVFTRGLKLFLSENFLIWGLNVVKLLLGFFILFLCMKGIVRIFRKIFLNLKKILLLIFR